MGNQTQVKPILLSKEEIEWGLENGLTNHQIERGAELGHNPKKVLEIREMAGKHRENARRSLSSPFSMNPDGTINPGGTSDLEIRKEYSLED